MKILHLTFKNINSLAGVNKINFSDPMFTDNGLFAITGKTGAGKSSILDAITLALFGKTPRVDITGLYNDVMTRGTGDCFSEIVFEAGGKKWKAAWKQERTRTGNLKPVHRTIADANNTIIAEKIKDCDSTITQLLGLDFEQFTKVILLAQGSFAAFLQADKNDKGELLEHITGTEIYGEISKKVYERHKTEKEKLDKILVEIGAIKILSDDEITAINHEIAELEEQKRLIDGELQKIEIARKWLTDLESLQRQIDDANAKTPELQQRALAKKEAFEQTGILLQDAKNEKDKTDTILIKVRELDTQIDAKNKLLAPVVLSIKELKAKEHELSQLLERQKDNIEKSQTTLTEKIDWAAKNEIYESLVGQYAAIEHQDAQAQAILLDWTSKQKEHEAAGKEKSDKAAALQKSQTGFTKAETALQQKNQEIENKKTALQKVLSGKELNDYRQEKENMTGFGNQIRQLIEVETAIINHQTEIGKYAALISDSEKSEQELTAIVKNGQTNKQNIETQIHALEEIIKLTRTIQSLDEHRKALEDGKPCPLCGAREHPYAIGNIPQTGEKETELKALKQQLQTVTTTVQQAEKTLTKCASDKDNALRNKEKDERLLSSDYEKRMTVLIEMRVLQPDFAMPESENKVALLSAILSRKEAEYKQVNDLILQATAHENALSNLRNKEIPTLQKAKEEAEKLMNKAATDYQLAEHKVDAKQLLSDEARKSYNGKNDALQLIFQKYGVENITALKNCLDRWKTYQAAIISLTELISNLNNELTATTTETNSLSRLLADKASEQQSIVTERQSFVAERTAIFGDRQVTAEEQRLKNMLEKAETVKANAEKSKTAAETELAKCQAVITEKEKELTAKQAQVITGKSPEELQSELEEKKTQSESVSQKTGANRQKLADNAENLKNSGDKLKEKEWQQQICANWGGQNELIGSADGKRYRNFAQALTFEHLIVLANRQLQKMSDRYLLKRTGDAANPFELSVIDKFQNCEERTAQNLSGGEKFIASLSLALGLSGMASKNMQIDTMFIDEGFGTLDSDYLDVALSALSNLHREGKIIGVISHLAELKERIATHIEVTPVGNGHSRIEIS